MTMTREAMIDSLRLLAGHIEELNGECVDDPEEIMTELGCNAQEFTDALEMALAILDPAGPDDDDIDEDEDDCQYDGDDDEIIDDDEDDDDRVGG